MKMKNSYIFIVAMIIGFIVSGFLFTKCGKIPENETKIDTVTVHDTCWKDTTITKTELVPKIIVKKKVDTVYSQKGDTIQLITESKRYDEVLTSGVDTCEVSAFVSGIHPLLDSLSMRLKTHKEVITNTITIEKYIEKKKSFKDRFHIQPQVGVGYGVIQRKIDIYLGVGIGVDI